MNYQNFDDYIDSLKVYDERLALTIRPFLKIERLSYKQLRQQIYQTAHFLSARGIGSGDRILIVANNSPEWVKLFLGSQLIGAVVITVDARNSLATTRQFIKQTTPKLIFRSNLLHPELNKDYSTFLINELDQAINDFPITKPDSKLKKENTSLIVFTSGTTADPKGVVLSQKNVLANVYGIQQAIDINPDWRFLSVLPLSHMYELGASLAILSRGASIFYMPSVTPKFIAQSLQEYHITSILAIPQLLIILMERIKQTAKTEGKAQFLTIALTLVVILPMKMRRLLFHSIHSRLGGKLDLLVTGGAPIPIEVASFWERLGVRALQGYGLTETSPILTVNRLNERRFDSAGQVLSNVQLRIANNNEIQAKGPSVFKEYWQNPAASVAAFTEDGWFKTGDVGHIQNGWLQIQGRLKFAIVLSNGLKVFPEDIELVADKYPVFQEICIVGVKQHDNEEVLAVIISKKPDSIINQTIAEVNAKLESFQHITAWRRWPDSDFPRTRLLKIDRQQVWNWANNNSSIPTADVSDKLISNDNIANIIRLSLNQPNAKFKEADRLADIGLDSLRRLNVIALIEEQLGISIAEEQVTQITTVAELRNLVSQSDQVESVYTQPTWPFQKWIRFFGNGLRETVIHGIVRIWVKLDVEGQDNLGNISLPALFIFNHTDDFDGPVVYQALPHYIRKRLSVAAADDVLREHKVLAFIVRLGFAGFNFARTEPYMPSLEYVCKLVDMGRCVVLAPEGRLSTTYQLQPFKSGIGLLAVNLGIPVVPMKTFGLSGTVPLHAKWPKHRSHVTVRIGQPVYFNRQTSYESATLRLHNIMEML